MKRLTQKQIIHGHERLTWIASQCGVTNATAARILGGKQFVFFWKWSKAEEFLEYYEGVTE